MGLREIALLAGLAFPMLAGAGIMNLFSGFTVEREVILESSDFHAAGKLAKAADGGYFVVSAVYGGRAWASKTDSQGNLLWTYQEPHHDPSRDEIISNFESAAPAQDGGVLLCGWRKRGRAQSFRQTGLLVLLNKDGQETRRVEPSFEDESHRLVYFHACAPWGDDFVVIGNQDVKDPSSNRESHESGVYMVLRLHADGTLIWQKDIDLGDGGGAANTPQVMLNGDLVFKGLERVARIDSSGNLLNSTKVDPRCRLFQHVNRTDRIQLVCYTDHPDRKNAEVDVLNQSLQIIHKIELPAIEMSHLDQAYDMPDHSIVLFGSTLSLWSAYVPTLILFGPDGSLTDKYQFEGALNQGWIADGMPTGVAGEFVTIRATAHQIKTAMTFLHR